ncbi:hypothetical protein BDV18DRAFT_128993, partial [Aspergillus unguis]
MADTNLGALPSENSHTPRTRSQPASYFSLSKLIVMIVSSIILLGSFVYKSSGGPHAPAIGEVDDSQLGMVHVEKHECPLLTTRYSIRTGQTACYPSSGGIWMAELGPIELQHLGIARFQSTERSTAQADEDAFCNQLRKFGGSWYNPASGEDLWSGGQCLDLNELMEVFSISRKIGFTESGGVWALQKNKETGRYPPDFVQVRNALTMEERCLALERLGAVYCDDVSQCSLFDDLSKEPYELAKEYQSLEGQTWCGTF